MILLRAMLFGVFVTSAAVAGAQNAEVVTSATDRAAFRQFYNVHFACASASALRHGQPSLQEVTKFFEFISADCNTVDNAMVLRDAVSNSESLQLLAAELSGCAVLKVVDAMNYLPKEVVDRVSTDRSCPTILSLVGMRY